MLPRLQAGSKIASTKNRGVRWRAITSSRVLPLINDAHDAVSQKRKRMRVLPRDPRSRWFILDGPLWRKAPVEIAAKIPLRE